MECQFKASASYVNIKFSNISLDQFPWTLGETLPLVSGVTFHTPETTKTNGCGSIICPLLFQFLEHLRIGAFGASRNCSTEAMPKPSRKGTTQPKLAPSAPPVAKVRKAAQVPSDDMHAWWLQLGTIGSSEATNTKTQPTGFYSMAFFLFMWLCWVVNTITI